MENTNRSYSNSTNVAVLGTSVNETSEIMVYEHPLFGKVRMFVENGKSWFCATDIATSLLYANPRDAIARHCKSHGVVNHDVIDSMGRTQQMKFISEGNIYRLTAKSQMPKADEFESWIFDDVVPSVINTGSYSLQPQLPNFNNPAEAARAWADQYEKNQTLALENAQKQILIEQKEEEILIKDEKIKILVPKGDTFDKIMSSEGLVTTNMIAAFLGISAIKLNKLLCDWGVQYRQSKTYFLAIKYRNQGYTKHVPYPYMDNGVQKSREHMYWTEKGRKFVIELYHSKLSA